uniref:Ig-like domain-containing protein n=1 Tax=Acanthochromis polyacanthus TaxID=80966 RepID=A0A3Q1GXH8_9TELE
MLFCQFVNIFPSSLFLDHVCSQKITASQNPVAVGSSVTLSSTVQVTRGIWLFNNNLIVFISPGTFVITNSWSDRVAYNSATSSLTLRSLTLDDSGIYTLQDLNGFRAQLTLSVRVPISNVTLWAKETNLVEYNDTAVLMCSVSNGSSLSFEWLNGNSTVTAGGQVLLSNGNATLTILNVTHHYQGPFRCSVSNGISHEISGPVHLNISYGPSNTTMMITPMKDVYKSGSNIMLSCSAESSPPAMIQWIVNGVYLNHSGPQLQLENVTEGNSGNYKCEFHNTATSRFSSASAMIQVLGKVGIVEGDSPLLDISTVVWKKFYCEFRKSREAWHFSKMEGLVLRQCKLSKMLDHYLKFQQHVPHSFKPHPWLNLSNAFPFLLVDPITAVMVKPTGGPAMLHEPFTLQCEVTGSADTILWWMDGQLITADNSTVFGMSNKTLTLKSVQTSDNEYYKCQAFNSVSNMTSSPYTVEVIYGPEMPTITGPAAAKTGDNVTLCCYAPSNPPSHYKWYFNGSLVSNMSEYITPPLPKDTVRKYICMAFNNVTGQNSSAYFMLTVIAPDNLATEGYSYNLTCNVTGPADHVYWMKNGEPLHEDNTTVFFMDNKTVSFIPLNRYDTGYYQCVAVNAVEKVTSAPHMLLVNFGPETPIIQGPAYAETGGYAIFNCSAMSVPPSHFSWWYNGSMVANTSVFTAGPLSLNMTGEYTCMCSNNRKNKLGHNNCHLTLILTNSFCLVADGPVSVTISGSDSAELGTSGVSLTCSAVSQPECHFYWFLNNQSNPLTNGSVITFSVTKESEGTYICKARNPVTNITLYQNHTFAISAINGLLLSVFTIFKCFTKGKLVSMRLLTHQHIN